jgi:ferredoxin--NADP+ reductase
MEVEAPEIAKRAKAGQFIILRTDEYGERIPLTIAATDKQAGTVTIIYQLVGRTTMQLDTLEPGDALLDFAGPLGKPTELDGIERAAVVGGGVGCAIAMPVAKALFDKGAKVDIIAGFRSKDIVILEEEMRGMCDNYYLMTDDGTAGEHGFTTTKLKELLDAGEQYDVVIASAHHYDEARGGYGETLRRAHPGEPQPHHDRRHRYVRRLPRDGGRQDAVCLCARPGFRRYEVDFDELMKRNGSYKPQETEAREHICRMTGGLRHG